MTDIAGCALEDVASAGVTRATPLQEIVIWCAADGRPFEGAWALLTMPVWSKNSHGALIGPTGSNGRASLSIDAIQASIDLAVNRFPMDYRREVDWNGTFWVKPIDADEARGAIKAIDLWSLDSVYPGRRRQLAAFAQAAENLGDRAITLDAAAIPEGAIRVRRSNEQRP